MKKMINIYNIASLNRPRISDLTTTDESLLTVRRMEFTLCNEKQQRVSVFSSNML